MDTFRMRLKVARVQKEMTQEELAKFAGVGRTTIANLETGQSTNMRSDRLAKIAEALDVSMDYLVLGKVPQDA